MPIFLLRIKAEFDNVESISIPLDASFCIDVRESGGTEVRERVFVSSTEEHDISGSKGTANFVLKFEKGSKHESTINVIAVKGMTRNLTADDEHKFVPIIALDCRGLEPIAYHPEAGWTVTAVGGTKFEDVDLEELEWADYDEKKKVPVAINGFESEFKLHKGS